MKLYRIYLEGRIAAVLYGTPLYGGALPKNPFFLCTEKAAAFELGYKEQSQLLLIARLTAKNSSTL